MSTENEKTKNGLTAAQLDVGGVLAMDRQNIKQGYDYVSTDRILTVGGQAMARHGLEIIPEIVEESIDPVERKDGRIFWLARVVFHMRIIDNGQEKGTYRWPGSGVAWDSPEKALYQAITAGHGYFVRKLLNIGQGNEDGQHKNPPGEKGGQKAEPKNPASKKPPVKAANGGTIPLTQQLVDLNLAENVFSAAKILNMLQPSGKDPDVIIAEARIYREWREAGKEPKEAAELVLAKQLPEDIES